ncbi:MAG TPA: hypothetical protein VMU14_23055 [Acidimicrobiales bacterium]|nr:hypothetical protein [Acidimicrobiales bacterium]
MDAAEQYRIVVRHQLGETLRSAFPELTVTRQGGDTVLSGRLPDQAALYGVLARLEGLGLELLEVRRVPRDGASPPRTDPQIGADTGP